jgi:hypothetical protein
MIASDFVVSPRTAPAVPGWETRSGSGSDGVFALLLIPETLANPFFYLANLLSGRTLSYTIASPR